MTDSANELDIAATRQYANRASRTWIDKFLLNGSTTRGDRLSSAEREVVLDIWATVIDPNRLLACAWDAADLVASAKRGITPMAVMRDLRTSDEALAFLRQLPSNATIYSHPMFGVSFTPDLAQRAAEADCLPVGGKLAKIDLCDIHQFSDFASEFLLWDGSSRHIRRSLEAGAAGIVITPLAAQLDETLPPKSISAVQIAVDRVQIELDLLPNRAERTKHLLQQASSAL